MRLHDFNICVDATATATAPRVVHAQVDKPCRVHIESTAVDGVQYKVNTPEYTVVVCNVLPHTFGRVVLLIGATCNMLLPTLSWVAPGKTLKRNRGAGAPLRATPIQRRAPEGPERPLRVRMIQYMTAA